MGALVEGGFTPPLRSSRRHFSLRPLSPTPAGWLGFTPPIATTHSNHPSDHPPLLAGLPFLSLRLLSPTPAGWLGFTPPIATTHSNHPSDHPPLLAGLHTHSPCSMLNHPVLGRNFILLCPGAPTHRGGRPDSAVRTRQPWLVPVGDGAVSCCWRAGDHHGVAVAQPSL